MDRKRLESWKVVGRIVSAAFSAERVRNATRLDACLAALRRATLWRCLAKVLLKAKSWQLSKKIFCTKGSLLWRSLFFFGSEKCPSPLIKRYWCCSFRANLIRGTLDHSRFLFRGQLVQRSLPAFVSATCLYVYDVVMIGYSILRLTENALHWSFWDGRAAFQTWILIRLDCNYCYCFSTFLFFFWRASIKLRYFALGLSVWVCTLHSLGHIWTGCVVVNRWAIFFLCFWSDERSNWISLMNTLSVMTVYNYKKCARTSTYICAWHWATIISWIITLVAKICVSCWTCSILDWNLSNPAGLHALLLLVKLFFFLKSSHQTSVFYTPV